MPSIKLTACVLLPPFADRGPAAAGLNPTVSDIDVGPTADPTNVGSQQPEPAKSRRGWKLRRSGHKLPKPAGP
jgi:hypothetical protein